MSIFSLIPAIYAAIHVYFFIELRVAYGRGLWQIPVALFFVCMVLGWRFLRRSQPGFWGDIGVWVAMAWFGVALFLLMCLISSDILRLLFWAGGKASPALAGLLTARRAVTLALLAATALSAYSAYNARNPRISHVEIATAKLTPAQLEGAGRLRIAFLTDIHLSQTVSPRDLQRILDTAVAEQPDMLVITGDLVDMDMSWRTDHELFRAVPARYGIYAVMGNHEYYRGIGNSREFMRRSGIRLLRGEAVQAGPIVVVGVDDPVFGSTGATKALPLLRELDQENFIVLLRHRPEIEDGTAGLFDIQLSGHTHGGQIWPGYWLTRLANDYHRALSHINASVSEQAGEHVGEHTESLVYVSEGAGYWGPPMRFLTHAEVVIVDIVPGKK